MSNLPCHFGLVGNHSLFAGGTMCINQFFLTYSKGNMKAGPSRMGTRLIPCSDLSVVQERVFTSVGSQRNEVKPEMLEASD